MAKENKQRYYWIKLKDTFMSSDSVDFLMSQKGGANYVVLYQMLCLKSVNTDGLLARQLGEIFVPYNVEKIKRECKYFETDTIVVALELFKKLGLVLLDSSGALKITDFDRLVGSETEFAEKKRIYREEKKKLKLENKGTLSKTLSTKVSDPMSDKRLDIDIRDIDIDIKDINTNTLSSESTMGEVKKVKYNYLNDVSFIAKSEEIIKVLNETLNSENKPSDKEKNFGNKTKSTLSLIHSRLKEGRTVKDFEYVITNQYAYWHGTDYQKFLRPQTLFGNKFESYLMADKFIAKPKDFNKKSTYEKPKY